MEVRIVDQESVSEMPIICFAQVVVGAQFDA